MRLVNPAGIITTVVGTGRGAGGATERQLVIPWAVAVDVSGSCAILRQPGNKRAETVITVLRPASSYLRDGLMYSKCQTT